jgi:hypothetical protein
MHRIEDQWLHRKRDELAGRVFEDEFALAMAIVAGMECRALQGQYGLERFIFTYSGVQADAVRLSVLLWYPPCVPTPPIYVTASSPFTNKVKGQFDN